MAWEETDGTLRARTRASAGAPFGERDHLGVFPTEYTDDIGYCCGEVSLAMARDGRALAAWSYHELVDIGPDSGSELASYAYVAVAAPGRAFGGPTRLIAADDSEDALARAAFTGAGMGVVAWSNEFDVSYSVVSGTRLGPRRRLADGALVAVAGGADTALIGWPVPDRNASLRAARLRGGALTGPPEPIRGPAGRDEAAISELAAAFDPRTGRPSFIWVGPPRRGDGSAVHTAERR